jgi:CheY-like chemotaxis protein
MAVFGLARLHAAQPSAPPFVHLADRVLCRYTAIHSGSRPNEDFRPSDAGANRAFECAMSQFATVVLIVDDDEAVRRTLAQLVSSRGYSVLEASDGEEAWELLQTEPVDVVVSDLQMPRCDGRELCQRIRDEPSLCDMRIVIISGCINIPDQETLRCDSILTKPISLATLLDEIERAIASVAGRYAARVTSTAVLGDRQPR